MKTKPIIFQAKNGAIELRSDLKKETIWASLDQIAYLFGRDKSVISRHIKNIFKENELERDSVVAFFATTANDGKTYRVEYFNLDMVISVGYRVNSVLATQFRKWATKTLKQHITQGYTINKKLLQKNYNFFQQALADIQTIAKNTLLTNDVLELVKAFSATWFSLDAYDKENFITKKSSTKKTIQLEASQLYSDIQVLKQEVCAKDEATDLFAQEREHGSIQSIFANVFQTAFKQDVYPSLESKAAHLLYFIVKNHPFIDGNKRCGAFAFIWFLQKTHIPFRHTITPETLAAITLLIAMSDPREKEKMIGLVILLLQSNSFT